MDYYSWGDPKMIVIGPPNSDGGSYYIANYIANSLTRLVFKLLTLGVNCNKFVAWKYSYNR